MPKLSVQKGEHLIATIRANRALYDPSHKDYSDFGVKAKLWNRVAAKCGIKTGQEAKIMWKNLRDSYRISRNKLYYNPNRMWKFYKHMEFIAPFTRQRKFRGRSEAPTPVEIDFIDPEFDNETQGEFTTIQYWNDSDKDEPTKTGSELPHEQNVVLELPPEAKTLPVSPLESDHESYEDVLPVALNKASVDNSLKMFFDAMYASTIQLPQILQRKVKNGLFAAVLEAEEEAETIKASASKDLTFKTEIN